MAKLEEDVKQLALLLPNIPSSKTPVGKSEEDNVEIRTVGKSQPLTLI